jgi:hypothetical protein
MRSEAGDLAGGKEGDGFLTSSSRAAYYAYNEYNVAGFRVASVPEPATMGLLALGGIAVLRRRRK